MGAAVGNVAALSLVHDRGRLAGVGTRIGLSPVLDEHGEPLESEHEEPALSWVAMLPDVPVNRADCDLPRGVVAPGRVATIVAVPYDLLCGGVRPFGHVNAVATFRGRGGTHAGRPPLRSGSRTAL